MIFLECFRTCNSEEHCNGFADKLKTCWMCKIITDDFVPVPLDDRHRFFIWEDFFQNISQTQVTDFDLVSAGQQSTLITHKVSLQIGTDWWDGTDDAVIGLIFGSDGVWESFWFIGLLTGRLEEIYVTCPEPLGTVTQIELTLSGWNGVHITQTKVITTNTNITYRNDEEFWLDFWNGYSRALTPSIII